MDLDVTNLIGAVTREVSGEMREGKPARVAAASRAYDTTIEDLWDAITHAERIERWFMPVSGDLRLGGHYQLEGNAGGTITACRAPSYLAATWEFGGEMSWIEVELSALSEGETNLRLKHIAYVDDERWQQFGPGAVGVGWDLSLLGLHLHIVTGAPVDPREVDEWSTSESGKEYVRLASDDWGRASIAAGSNEAEALAAAERTRAFYTGEGGEPPMDGV